MKIQLTKIWSKNDKEIKVSPLMPIRVKVMTYEEITEKSSMQFFQLNFSKTISDSR